MLQIKWKIARTKELQHLNDPQCWLNQVQKIADHFSGVIKQKSGTMIVGKCYISEGRDTFI